MFFNYYLAGNGTRVVECLTFNGFGPGSNPGVSISFVTKRVC